MASNPITTPNWKNRTIFIGDNLATLRAMNTNSIHLITTDPTYNTGRRFKEVSEGEVGISYDDIYKWSDLHEEWFEGFNLAIRKCVESELEYGDLRTAAFLCYMAPRYIEMERVLVPDGSIYLFCDANSSYCIRNLMNAVFGKTRFKKEIIRKLPRNPNSAINNYGTITDRILFYGDKIQMDEIRTPHKENYLNKCKKDDRGYYVTTDITAPSDKITNKLKWKGYTPPGTRDWSLPLRNAVANYIIENLLPNYREIKSIREKLDALNGVGMIHFSNNGVPSIKKYVSQIKGIICYDLWDKDKYECGELEKEDVFDTQKPVVTMERIIKASSKPGDTIFDPFMGSCTTANAAERLGREWVGCDINPKSYDRLIRRLKKDKKISKLPLLYKETTIPKRDFTDVEVLTVNQKYDNSFTYQNVSEIIPSEHESMEVIRSELLIERQELSQSVGLRGGRFLCIGCMGDFPDPESLVNDHIIPKSKGGKDVKDNIQLLCHHCNMKKGHKVDTLEQIWEKNLKCNRLNLNNLEKYKKVQNREKVKKGQILMNQFGKIWKAGIKKIMEISAIRIA